MYCSGRRPADDVILRLQQVFVARELRPDVHLHALAKQCAGGIGGYDAEVGEQRAGIDLLQAVVRAVDRQGRGVGIGDVRLSAPPCRSLPESSHALKSARLFVLEPWIMESIMLPMTLTE